jgi:hypothetical protein
MKRFVLFCSALLPCALSLEPLPEVKPLLGERGVLLFKEVQCARGQTPLYHRKRDRPSHRSPSISYNGTGATGFGFDSFKNWEIK